MEYIIIALLLSLSTNSIIYVVSGSVSTDLHFLSLWVIFSYFFIYLVFLETMSNLLTCLQGNSKVTKVCCFREDVRKRDENMDRCLPKPNVALQERGQFLWHDGSNIMSVPFLSVVTEKPSVAGGRRCLSSGAGTDGLDTFICELKPQGSSLWCVSWMD